MGGIGAINVDVGSVLGGLGDLAKDIREAITGRSILDPNKQAELLQRAAELEAQAAQAQTAINVEEAKSGSVFVAGWRPFVGWVCGSALAYHYIAMPFLVWIVELWGFKTTPPSLEMGELMTLLLGILGLGAYRSYDKGKNGGSKQG